jgi:hypothetical protein
MDVIGKIGGIEEIDNLDGSCDDCKFRIINDKNISSNILLIIKDTSIV